MRPPNRLRRPADQDYERERANHYATLQKLRAEKVESERIMVEATTKLKEMIGLCDRQRGEIKHLRKIIATARLLLSIE